MSKNNNITPEDVIGALNTVGIDAPADVLASEILGISLDKLYEIIEVENDEEYTPSATNGDYSPSNPWDAPGMKLSDFI